MPDTLRSDLDPATAAELVARGRKVLETEGAALALLAAALDDGFAGAVDLMRRATGRIVVSGRT
ncbi:MAG: hypothetical protein AAFW69_08125 [Pseudomonadota bacterium]